MTCFAPGPHNAWVRAFVGLVALLIALFAGVTTRVDVCVAADGCHNAVITANSLDPETPAPDARHFVTSATPGDGLTIKNCLAAPARHVDRFGTYVADAGDRAPLSPDTAPQFRTFPLLI